MGVPVPDRDDPASAEISGQVADRLRGFGPVGLLASAVILSGNLLVAPLSAVLVLAWAHLSRTPWRSLGFAPPRSWKRTFAVGILFGIAFKLVMKAVVMPLFGAPAVNPHYHYLAGNTAALPWSLAVVIVVAGFGEETLFRGFFFERLGKLLGRDRAALVATVLLTSGLFALAHYPDQGLAGMQQAGVTGVVFGTIYVREGRIWIPMVAHAVFNITAIALIYWEWESAVAHLFFR